MHGTPCAPLLSDAGRCRLVRQHLEAFLSSGKKNAALLSRDYLIVAPGGLP